MVVKKATRIIIVTSHVISGGAVSPGSFCDIREIGLAAFQEVQYTSDGIKIF